MTLALLLCLTTGALAWLTSVQEPDIQPYVTSLHQMCLDHLPPLSLWKEAHAAVVCGKKLKSGASYDAFRSSGLLHLLVVSGAHLLFLERILRRVLPFLPKPMLWTSLICTTYACMALLHPPVVRALLSLHLHLINRHFKLFWRKDQEVLYTGLVCLCIFPSWSKSYSLALSWAASLALTLPWPKSPWKPLLQSFSVYLLLWPFLMSFAPQHPATIMINWIGAPFIGSILFPASILSALFHPLTPVADFLWNISTKGLSLISETWSPLTPQPGWPLVGLWVFVIIFHILNHFLWIYLRRRRCFNESF